jgi:hypothetical protein
MLLPEEPKIYECCKFFYPFLFQPEISHYVYVPNSLQYKNGWKKFIIFQCEDGQEIRGKLKELF